MGQQLYNTAWNIGHAVWPTVLVVIVWVWRKLNGNFSAALFGAMGAYMLASRNERRNKLREEIVATNNAIGMVNNIINAMLSLKGQHVNPIVEQYLRSFQEYFDAFVAPRPAGQGPVEFHLQGDFRVISAPDTVIEELQKWILDRVTRSPAAPMLVASLRRSVQQLTRVIDQRTHLINVMRQIPQDDVRVRLYWGLPDATGNVDDTYPDTMSGTVAYLDDCIYFSDLLMEILAKHGAALRKAYGRKAPKILKLDMTDPRVVALMPARSHYVDFEEQFRRPAPLSRWERFQAWIAGRASTVFQRQPGG